MRPVPVLLLLAALCADLGKRRAGRAGPGAGGGHGTETSVSLWALFPVSVVLAGAKRLCGPRQWRGAWGSGPLRVLFSEDKRAAGKRRGPPPTPARPGPAPRMAWPQKPGLGRGWLSR